MSAQLGIDRRTFLRGTAVGTAGLALGILRPRPAAARLAAAATPPRYGDWRDVYAQRWRWDSVTRSTHFVNCWYQAHCCFNVYVRDGIVWREEQAADYPQTRPDVPDFNPRGCQKGSCLSERMYDAARLRYPLKRVGERGSGRWQRIPWDQALEEIADAMLETLASDGSDRIVWDQGIFGLGASSAALLRLTLQLDSTVLDMNTEIGDGHRGAAETFGKIVFERSADDYFFSDLILIWGGNPTCTQIPNAHFLHEARYHGAELVCIAPDYSPSSIHTDLFVPVKPGFDAALGLAIAHVLVEEDLVDRDFMVEQTDLPLLVREDNRLFLRSSHLERGGSDEELYLHDPERGIVLAPRRSLALAGLRPALEGRFAVTLRDGTQVFVRPVFSLLRERLRDYSPEKASAICGTPASLIRDLAHRFARARSVSMVTTSNISKYYHGNLIERTQALVYALTGNYGKKGSGFVGFPLLALDDGFEGHIRSMFSLSDMLTPRALKMIGGILVDDVRMRLAGYTPEMISAETIRKRADSGSMNPGALFWYLHGGLIEASEKVQEWDPYLKRPVRAVLEESFEKGWQYVWPRRGNDPKLLFLYASNPLRRLRGYSMIRRTLWPKLRAIVTLDWRMTTTALHSDYVLPVSSWYERTDHKWVTPLMPFVHVGRKATSYYEAKSDWEILSRLTEMLERRGHERNMLAFVDRFGGERSLDGLYRRFSQKGEFGHTDDAKVAKSIVDHSAGLGETTWEELEERGWARFSSLGKGGGSISNATEIRPDDTITPLTKHVLDKDPYPTLSRRMQFYLDQELYLEMGEELPVHKDPPISGGDYPLMLTGGHARWSIHSNWRDDLLMLRLQRGAPVMYMSREDAGRRKIQDGDRVRVFNDIDWFEIPVRVSPAVRPGQLIVYHAWDNFQFRGRKGFQSLMPAPLNPVELAGGQSHIRPVSVAMQPGHTDRDTRVEVEPV